MIFLVGYNEEFGDEAINVLKINIWCVWLRK